MLIKASYTLTLTLMLVILSSGAESEVHMDMPCVNEVCINDNLKSLKSISWEKTINPSQNSTKKYEKLKPIYYQFPDKVSDHLYRGTFDGSVLSYLEKITYACKPHDLIGSYLSSSGHKTKVTLRLSPDQKGQQSWRVIAISRVISGDLRRTDVQSAFSQMDRKYADYDSHIHPPKEWHASYIKMFIGQPAFLLQLQLPIPDKLQRLYEVNPLCPKSNYVSIE